MFARKKILLPIIWVFLVLNLNEALAQAQSQNQSKKQPKELSPEELLLKKTENYFDAQEIIARINWEEEESLQKLNKLKAEAETKIKELEDQYNDGAPDSVLMELNLNIFSLKDRQELIDIRIYDAREEIADMYIEQAGFVPEEIERYKSILAYNKKYQEMYEEVMVSRFNDLLNEAKDVLEGMSDNQFKKVMTYFVDLNVKNNKIAQDLQTGKITQLEQRRLIQSLQDEYNDLVARGEITNRQYAQMEFAISKSYLLTMFANALSKKRYSLKFN
jgi:hypothetical protein